MILSTLRDERDLPVPVVYTGCKLGVVYRYTLFISRWQSEALYYYHMRFVEWQFMHDCIVRLRRLKGG